MALAHLRISDGADIRTGLQDVHHHRHEECAGIALRKIEGGEPLFEALRILQIRAVRKEPALVCGIEATGLMAQRSPLLRKCEGAYCAEEDQGR
jgi:hypothetical protein